MDIAQIPLFALADQRLAWVSTRQAVLAQNIANADTAGFRARDVTPFASLLAHPALALAGGEPGHLAGTPSTQTQSRALPGELSPDGNSVALDAELAKIADTDTAHEFAVNVSKKYLGMFRTAIGR